MKYFSEEDFLSSMDRFGVELCNDERSLCYKNSEETFGFDFTNLAEPDMENEEEGGHKVERSMLETTLALFESLSLFPVTLFAVNDEWTDEETVAELTKSGYTGAELEIIKSIVEEGHSNDAIEITPDEKDFGVKLLLTEMTIIGSTTCAIIGRGGEALALVSRDDEVSFDTATSGVYETAKKYMKSRESSIPFEIIWGE